GRLGRDDPRDTGVRPGGLVSKADGRERDHRHDHLLLAVIHDNRQRLRAIMHLLIAHKAQLDYPLHDVRGPKDAETFRLTWKQAQERLASSGHLMFDCSGCVTCIYKWAGLSDPNGLHFEHEGYT